MQWWGTGPWLRGARYEDGLLLPGRNAAASFDLLLAPEHAWLRGPGLLRLPWSSHLDFATSETSSTGWYVGAWGGMGEGIAVILQGSLEDESRALPVMQSLAAKWARTPSGGSRAPLHRSRFVRQSDKDVVHALCTTLMQREELRSRLSDRQVVQALLARIITTPHAREGSVDGARQLTIATSNALRALGCTLPIGGRPLPDEALPSASDLLPRVLEHIRASPYANRATISENKVLTIIQRNYSDKGPWPFEPLFA